MSGPYANRTTQEEEQYSPYWLPPFDTNALNPIPDFLNNFLNNNNVSNFGQSGPMYQHLHASHRDLHSRYLQPLQPGQSQPPTVLLTGSAPWSPLALSQHVPSGSPSQQRQFHQWQNSCQHGGMRQEDRSPVFQEARNIPQSQGYLQECERQQRQDPQVTSYQPGTYANMSFLKPNTSFNSDGSVIGYDAASGDFPGSSALSSGIQTNPSQPLSSYATSISSFPAPSKPSHDNQYRPYSLKDPSNQVPVHVSSSLNNAAGRDYFQSASLTVNKNSNPSRRSQQYLSGSNLGQRAYPRAPNPPASHVLPNTDIPLNDVQRGAPTLPAQKKRKGRETEAETTVNHLSAPMHRSTILDAESQTVIWCKLMGAAERLHDYMDLAIKSPNIVWAIDRYMDNQEQGDVHGVCHWPQGQKLQLLADTMNASILEVQSFAKAHEPSSPRCSCPYMNSFSVHTTHGNPMYRLQICRRQDIDNVKAFITSCNTKQRQNKSMKTEGPYPCPEEGCYFLFSDFSSWLRHMEIRFPVEFYLCLLCDGDRIRSRNIGEHMRDTHKIEGGEARWKPHARRIEYDPPMDFQCPFPGCDDLFEGDCRAAGHERMLRHYLDVHIVERKMNTKQTSLSRHSSSCPRGRHSQGSPPRRLDRGNHFSGSGSYNRSHNPTQLGTGPSSQGHDVGRGNRYCSQGHQHAPSIDVPRGRQRSRATSGISSSKDSVRTGVSSIGEEDLRFIAQQTTPVNGAITTIDPLWTKRAASTGHLVSDDDSSDASAFDWSLEASIASLATNMTEHSPGPTKERVTKSEVLSTYESPVPAGVNTPHYTAAQVLRQADGAISSIRLIRHERRSTIPLIRTAIGRSTKASCTRLSSSLPRIGRVDFPKTRSAFTLPLRERSRLSTHRSRAHIKDDHEAHD